MFKGVVLRLTAFNAVVIAVILIASGVATYVSVGRSLTANQQDALLLAMDSVSQRSLEELFHQDIIWSYGARESGAIREEDDDEHPAPFAFPDAVAFAVDRSILYPLGTQVTDVTDADVLAAALEGTSGFGYAGLSDDDTSRRVYIVPVYGNRGVIGAVQVSVSDHERREAMASLRKNLLLVALVGAIAAVAGGALLSARGLRPVREAFDRQRMFIADASHQLKTPVAIVRADAEALERSGLTLDTEDAQILKDLVDSSTFLGDLVNQLLAIARMEGDQAEAPFQQIDLRDLVRETIRTTTRLAELRSVTLTDNSSSHERLMTLGSPPQLSLVLMALVENAIKYNRPGGTVSLALERTGDQATLTVTDTGAGIPKRDIERVWERFYRSDEARASSDDGAGLGLAIIRDVIRQHKGDISLTSELGKGTTIIVSLKATN